MGEKMTLEKVRDVLREMHEVGYWYSQRNSMRIPVKSMADAIEAHLATPAQTVDVEAVREVIATLRVCTNNDATTYMADKLSQAIGDKT